MPDVIVTAPPYADYLAEVAAHPVVRGFRLNTVMPLTEPIPDVLQRLAAFGLPLWIDLKGRQLRVTEAALPPYTALTLNHPISVHTPVAAYFADGTESVRVLAVDGNRLILEDGPRRFVGPGESINIVHGSLEIHGTLTDTDRAYLAAMRDLGLNRVMLSYVERQSDVAEVRDLLPDAAMVLKIESRRGLSYLKQHQPEHGQLMAARGDLFIEVGRPHVITDALKQIIANDPAAIVGSRLLTSLLHSPVPTNADISDVAYLQHIGYETFMLGDALCFNRDMLISALNLLQAIFEG